MSNCATLINDRGTLQGCGVHGDVLEISWHDGKQNVPRWVDELAATSD